MFNFFKRKPVSLKISEEAPERKVPEAILNMVLDSSKNRVHYPEPPTVPGLNDPGLASLAQINKNGSLGFKKYELPVVPKGVQPHGVVAGMDSNEVPFQNTDVMTRMDGIAALGFLGWPYLAQLAQIPEYNLINTVFADELIGSWITVKPSPKGEESDTREAIEQLKEDIEAFKLKMHLYHMVWMDGTFGKGTLYPHIVSTQGTPIDVMRKTPLVISPQTVTKGSLKYFKCIEPYWLSPQVVNTTAPLDEDFFQPSMWWVWGQQVHNSRLISLVMNPVPDLLKPYYMYGGLSRTQMCMPGTNRALRTLNNVTAMVEKYSIVALKTDLGGLLQNSQALDRIAWFNKVRNNMNMLLIDSANDEELVMANATLSGLKELAEQAVKFMAMYARIPNTKLLQDEIDANPLSGSKKAPQMGEWEQFVQIQRKNHLTPILTQMLDLLMLNRWGRIRKDIVVEWNPVHELDSEGKASLSLIKAQVYQILKSSDIVDSKEVRERVAADPDSEFAGIKGPPPPPSESAEGGGKSGSEHKVMRPEIREGGTVTISKRVG